MFNIYITKIFYNQYADGMLCINSAKYKDLKETHFWLARGIMLKPEQNTQKDLLRQATQKVRFKLYCSYLQQ